MKRQARERRVKELESNLDEIKTQSKSRADNPYYDNSYQTNVNSAQKRASDFLHDARTQIRETQSPDMRNPYGMRHSPNDENASPVDRRDRSVQFQNDSSPSYRRRQDDPETEMSYNIGKRAEPRYQENSTERVAKNQHLKNVSQDESTGIGNSINISSYRPSEEFSRIYKSEMKKDGLQWDNNTRGQKLKQDYNKYVSQELEKERQVNPRLKKQGNQNYEDGSYGNFSLNRQSVNPYSNGLSLPSLKVNQRQYAQQQDSAPMRPTQQDSVPRRTARQEAYANDLIDQVN